MNSYTVLCCIVGVLGLFALMMIPRMLAGFWKNRGIPGMLNNRNNDNQDQNASPGTFSPQYDDPNIESHGGFGRRPSSGPPGRGAKGVERQGRADDPNIQSRGGFGRDKD
jgi:hypothetical protein